MKKIILGLMILISSISFGKYEKLLGVKRLDENGVPMVSVDKNNYAMVYKGDKFDLLVDSFTGLKDFKVLDMSVDNDFKYLLATKGNLITIFYRKKDDITMLQGCNGNKNFLTYLSTNGFITGEMKKGEETELVERGFKLY